LKALTQEVHIRTCVRISPGNTCKIRMWKSSG